MINIKKAKEILKRWLGSWPSDQYVSYQALENILEGLDEPMEYPKFTYDIIREGIFKENEILKSELAKAHTELTNCGQRIYKLNEELAIANDLVKNLEEIIKRKDNVIQGYYHLIRSYTKET